MKNWLCIGFTIIMANATNSLASDFNPSKVEKKEFSLVNEYSFQVRKYSPSVVLNIVKNPPMVKGAEDALLSNLSSWNNANYDWWLKTWDANSTRKIIEKHKVAGITKERWVADRLKEGNANAQYKLIEWILRGRYVILNFQKILSDTSQEKSVKNHLMVFKISEGAWRPTLDLEDDLMLRYYLDGRSEVVQSLR